MRTGEQRLVDAAVVLVLTTIALLGFDDTFSDRVYLATGITGAAVVVLIAVCVTGAAGPEYLSAEIATDGGGRRAEVYYYDYRADRLVKQVVDLSTGRVTGSYSATGMQPPAARREIDAALNLLLAGPFGADLRQGFAAATGRAYLGPDDIVASAYIHEARPADTLARECGAHRCLQLVVQAVDGPFVDLDDLIIDLSGRAVVRLK